MLRRYSYFAIKFFASVAGIGVAFYLCLILCAALLKPDINQPAPTYEEEVVQKRINEREARFDSSAAVSIQQDVNYDEGESAAWFPRGESPILAQLVQSGELPPVSERVGSEPLVLAGPDGIGNYGGTWQRIATSPNDTNIMTNRMSGATLVRWSPMGYPIVPHIAKSWEHNEDRSEWTFHLRKGMKWSDGHPFTADDIVYWWEWDQRYFGSPPHIAFTAGGQPMEIEKIDDYTVRFKFAAPHGTFLENLATPSRGVYAPKHYLEPYHPSIGNEEKIEEAMEQRGIHSKRALYNSLKNYRNPEHPRLWPWVYRTWRATPPESFVRNPYYWAVDAEGNQLPYIDRVLFEIRTEQLLPISVAAGGVSMQARGLRFTDYTLLMENGGRNGYQVYHWYPATRSEWSMFPNLNRRVDEGDTVAKQKADLLNQRDFRIALSIAIDRQKIIDSLYNGVGTPAQIDPGEGSAFANPKLRNAYIQYTPEQANALLDSLGLTQRDSEGMRTLPDGQRMSWYIDYNIFTGEGPAQFIIDDWAQLGIRTIQRERNRALFFAQKSALINDFTVWSSESDFYPLSEPRSFVPANTEANYAISNARWFMRGGLYGAEDMLPGATEPEPGSSLRKVMELFEEARQAPTLDEQVAVFRKITDIAAEELWSISIATPPPVLAMVKNGLRNVPRNAVAGYSFGTPANTGIETYYWEAPFDSPGAVAQIQSEMTQIDAGRIALATASGADEGSSVVTLLRWVLIAIGVLLAVLIIVRHPYVGRRILIMIPTLLVISIVSFTIIELPPGDYVQTRMQELEATGDFTAMQEIERLRELFYLDEPMWQRYLRWMGFTWFISFDSKDAGLLQGQMGRSMETLDTVNAMVGDRIALTFWVSLGTIIFTWAIAFPIGIYSAVRQYSVGDYALSLIGFLGMCIPNFLLAILLMYISDRYFGVNVTGLFSPEYAIQPEWSWGKVLDLLKHIWIPVVVIATAGTAGLIRVMRGNLLDELGKPYVTTARAKGVRPFRLLMKYPVRLALNPFISGIGSIFPQLVSGGAIVAIVLSLPMVGPLLLQSLLSEDIYMAASMLMVLSTLGVLGTLISDLLLLWVDPRIRMEGGSR